MKKDTILTFVAFVLLVFALRSLAHEGCQSCAHAGTTYAAGKYKKPSGDDIDCLECCNQGRFASPECMEKCGGCPAYNDEAFAERWDFPTNG